MHFYVKVLYYNAKHLSLFLNFRLKFREKNHTSYGSLSEYSESYSHTDELVSYKIAT